MSTMDAMKNPLRSFKERGSWVLKQLKMLSEDRGAFISMIILGVFVLLGLFGPHIAPHHPIEHTMRQGQSVMRLESPSLAAPFGTTQYGKDVFSQFLTGARPTLIAGVVGGLFAAALGFLVGLTAGYFGGWIDEVLMRFTDLAFTLPGLPLVILVLSFVEPSVWLISLAYLAIIWKQTARVLRSEVITVKERTFVKGARASGAGHLRTMFVHVAPNVLPIGFLYGAYSVGWAIYGQAGIAFLGFGDPSTTSWGRMLRQAFDSGSMREAWWWVLPPALGIALVCVAVFFIGRAYEEIVNPKISES
jgi:peptide/nickel transport system permease protein